MTKKKITHSELSTPSILPYMVGVINQQLNSYVAWAKNVQGGLRYWRVTQVTLG